MRKVIFMIGSENDLPQCLKGFEYFASNADLVSVLQVYVASQHRHTRRVEEILEDLACDPTNQDVIIITAAGWAAHLPGCSDAFLRYTMINDKLVVIGVPLEDKKQTSAGADNDHNTAAILSISCVPGTQVIYRDKEGIFFGEQGFYRACVYAATGELPKIELKKIPPQLNMTLSEAIELAKLKSQPQ